MGVKGLWRLLLPIGRRISIETLEGQILAIDASIWLTQFLTVAARQREQDLLGESNRTSKAYSYDYLVGFLRRLCKLRYQGVRPVLVFDGETPEIKKREIRERNKRRKRKLGESFYLGDKLPTQEEEELLEATRRMAKRILAKQLKSGQLVTTKNKKLKGMKGGSAPSTMVKSKTIASASYAPGFYDPDAARVPASKEPPQQQQQQQQQDKKQSLEDAKDGDDDHLLRDDYNTNPLQEEINDWDKPIALDSDDENDTKHQENPSKQPIRKFLKNNSKFHAGDGTKFKVESVANLSESDRKDVIEDARKQRRLASRREFMGVASDPDGLSSCQLRNFLKSTKLNQDIAAMARQAKQKAEEEAKMTNGILFEKDDDDDNNNDRLIKGRSYGGSSTNRRRHYRSSAHHKKGKKHATLGMMRMFHHKDQLPNTNSASKNTQNNDSDDEHDFRKTRNNHYLSGGIRFVNSDEENKEIDGFMGADFVDEGRDAMQSHYQSKATEGDGGFAVAITDGSDKPKKKFIEDTLVDKSRDYDDDIIEIDSSSDSGDDQSEYDRKPNAVNYEKESTKNSQEMQDEALARALQNIEEEDAKEEECIEIDDNENDDGGGFFRHALPSPPSREQNDYPSQQESDDARLARALQKAEYDEEEYGGGGFLVGRKRDNVENEEEYGGGFLVGAAADDMQSKDTMDNGGGFIAPEEENDEKAENKNIGGGFMVSTQERDGKNINSQDLYKRQNVSASKHDETSVSNSVFAMSKNDLVVVPSEEEEDEDVDWEDGNGDGDAIGRYKEDPKKAKNEKNDLLVCPESSEDEGEDDLNWEDGATKSNEIKSAAKNISVAKSEMKLTATTKVQPIDEIVESDDDEVDWEEGDDNTENGVNTLPATILNTQNVNRKEFEGNIGDEEIDFKWEDGNNKGDRTKSGAIDLCEDKKQADSFAKLAFKKAGDTDDEDDEVDWVDGDDEKKRINPEIIDLVEQKTTKSSSLESSSSSAQMDAENDEMPVDENNEKLAESSRNSTVKKMQAVDTERKTSGSSKCFVSSSSFSKPKPTDEGNDSSDSDGIEWEAGEEGDRPISVQLDDWGVTKTRTSDEVAAALEHAQGTAANLTNWAGRAFRRAVAQHAIENGMKVPESAKPSALKNTPRDADEDESIYNETKVNSPQKISQASVQSRKQERRTDSDKIDNSSWLETVDTANTYTEDYTMAPQEANSSDRLLDVATGGVTEEMRTEVMQLLRLFGIPYVVAPAEAEAQCVELERLGLVDGIVTEDSDTFVFGGQVVYKNIFDDKKYVEVYHAKDASEEMNLTQDSLIALAMLLGGDYTEGVKGVGIVNGMEVLQAFDVAQDCEAGLKGFRKWLDGFDPDDLGQKNKVEDSNNQRSEKEQDFHRKHHTARTRWIAPKHFPDAKVLNAYLNPVVDTSTERFTWGVPDLDGLIAFCHGHMGWVAEETEKLIVPIIQQMEAGSMRQTRIDSFMRYEDGIKFAKIQSKRLRNVLGLSSNAEGPRRKKSQTKAPLPSRSQIDENNHNRFSGEEEEDSYGEPDEEIFAAMDTFSNVNVTKETSKPRKKKYTGKKSLAALSSASARTVAIANSSKGDGILTEASVSTVRRQPNQNLPKKAPPSYQKQSSTILEEEEEKESAVQSAKSGDKSTYEVINPSMI